MALMLLMAYSFYRFRLVDLLFGSGKLDIVVTYDRDDKNGEKFALRAIAPDGATGFEWTLVSGSGVLEEYATDEHRADVVPDAPGGVFVEVTAKKPLDDNPYLYKKGSRTLKGSHRFEIPERLVAPGQTPEMLPAPSTGNLTISVYADKNANGVLDEDQGEAWLEGFRVKVLNSEGRQVADTLGAKGPIRSPWPGRDLAPDRYTATVELESYHSQTVVRAVSAGQTALALVGLVPLPGKPVALFRAVPSHGCAPLEVRFTDESRDAITWSWEFGDGEGSKAYAVT